MPPFHVIQLENWKIGPFFVKENILDKIYPETVY